MGRDFGSNRDYSEQKAAAVDEEVATLIATAHQEAFDILTENRAVLDDLVRALFERETLDREQVAEVFKPLKLWPKRPAWTGSDLRQPSTIPPVTPPPPQLEPGSPNGVPGHGYPGGNGAPGGHGTPGGTPLPPGHQPTPPQLPGQPPSGGPGADLPGSHSEEWPPPPGQSQSGQSQSEQSQPGQQPPQGPEAR